MGHFFASFCIFFLVVPLFLPFAFFLSAVCSVPADLASSVDAGACDTSNGPITAEQCSLKCQTGYVGSVSDSCNAAGGSFTVTPLCTGLFPTPASPPSPLFSFQSFFLLSPNLDGLLFHFVHVCVTRYASKQNLPYIQWPTFPRYYLCRTQPHMH